MASDNLHRAVMPRARSDSLPDSSPASSSPSTSTLRSRCRPDRSRRRLRDSPRLFSLLTIAASLNCVAILPQVAAVPNPIVSAPPSLPSPTLVMVAAPTDGHIQPVLEPRAPQNGQAPDNNDIPPSIGLTIIPTNLQSSALPTDGPSRPPEASSSSPSSSPPPPPPPPPPPAPPSSTSSSRVGSTSSPRPSADSSDMVPTSVLTMPMEPTTMTSSASSTVDTSMPLPSPFDNAVASDFRGSNNNGERCPNFMTNLLGDPVFKACYPISMLIQTSRAFFEAQKQLVSIVRVLDASCRVDFPPCADFMDRAAQNLSSSANCKAELDEGQNLVQQAYRGLSAYRVLYAATCLQDERTQSYCYAQAVTNSSTPSDAYLYFMPYGLALPGASTPTCSWCTRMTMEIYRSSTRDRRQLVASKYEGAARQVNTLCGPEFVNSTLPRAEIAAGTMAIPSHLMTTVASMCAAAVLSAMFL